MNTPIANAESMQIGSVDFVSPDEIKAVLDLDAPNDVALNSGVPRPFPRINSYVLVSCEGGFLVSQIEWITVEQSQYPKRNGMKDFGVIDLPYPLRKMSLTPLGILREKTNTITKQSEYSFVRGIEMFPTVGDPVLLPSQNQLKSIVESGSNRRVDIGISPLAGNATVSIDPDRLFGRHLAVLGNTGSGKSCSVAGLVRWSIESAHKEKSALFSQKVPANTRFIILDPNGEYLSAFSDLPNVHIYGVEKDDARHIEQLVVPAWLWNSSEWVAFTQASSKTQKPTLVQSLRLVREGATIEPASPSHEMCKYLQTIIDQLRIEITNGSPWLGGGKSKGFKELINTWQKGLYDNVSFSNDEQDALISVRQSFENLLTSNCSTGPSRDDWPKYPRDSVAKLLADLITTHTAFGGHLSDSYPIDADVPRPFLGEDFLRSIEANSELLKTTEFVETMLIRVKALLSDAKLKPVISSDIQISLEEWMNKYICPSNNTEGSITVIDLSLVPAELTHIIVSVMARMTLESLQRYRKLNGGQTIPTVLIMEEAHTFIKKYNSDNENGSASEMCAKVFEKIAREGRKFGLGLVLSSQRPSELSPTVLSQCNSFLLHRISNDRDQELVNKLVPDNLRGLLRELPSLPSQNAILLGWASELPVMVKMNFLKEQYRPQSDDPDYWNVWTAEQRTVRWKTVADDWQGMDDTPITSPTEENGE